MEARKPSEAEAERLVETYADLILRLSYTYLKSTHDAEDICQTVLLKLMNAKPRFEGPEHEKAWIVRTTANACKDALRSGFRKRAVALDEAPDTAAPEEPDTGVTDAVMALPQKYREAIYLYYYEGYSVQEIADLTGRSVSAVSAHLSRGRGKLRTMLEGAYCEQGV
ncbi:RNA polymerase sigma factor [Gordonibacter massiliensis (ex Traore et al. 2017)]|uniref:Sigma-70 family RNA polymerase sigma factor n=1 Tax=Gordonibacter massiliensis (ex Traore et al. 2017) TaxID=1841863 RepID=A0A842JGD9_9ACTN|nr:sigma-70 family RNA polymerase sigma factor [Gordonibacter massiliensis (ex Traore et al. 2017)]MBC2889551.1 sigma-70 family RNA polymerase sigma factor [Gordonibacter massiliensis (ex Traore et al. 2017)]MBX9033106.1 sigma-70 family RNA polymerase sigma factor [Gordonibacter massiliensis (ex Traore et al. 2017)]